MKFGFPLPGGIFIGRDTGPQEKLEADIQLITLYAARPRKRHLPRRKTPQSLK